MGLAEKKAAREFQNNRYDSLKNQIDKEAGFEVEVEVDWETLSIEKYSHFYDETWPKIYFHPLIKALKEICSEDFAQEMVQENLKKVVIQNYSDNHNSDRFATFKNGVLTLNHSPIINADQIEDRARNIQTVVEKEL